MALYRITDWITPETCGELPHPLAQDAAREVWSNWDRRYHAAQEDWEARDGTTAIEYDSITGLAVVAFPDLTRIDTLARTALGRLLFICRHTTTTPLERRIAREHPLAYLLALHEEVIATNANSAAFVDATDEYTSGERRWFALRFRDHAGAQYRLMRVQCRDEAEARRLATVELLTLCVDVLEEHGEAAANGARRLKRLGYVRHNLGEDDEANYSWIDASTL